MLPTARSLTSAECNRALDITQRADRKMGKMNVWIEDERILVAPMIDDVLR